MSKEVKIFRLIQFYYNLLFVTWLIFIKHLCRKFKHFHYRHFYIMIHSLAIKETLILNCFQTEKTLPSYDRFVTLAGVVNSIEDWKVFLMT